MPGQPIPGLKDPGPVILIQIGLALRPPERALQPLPPVLHIPILFGLGADHGTEAAVAEQLLARKPEVRAANGAPGLAGSAVLAGAGEVVEDLVGLVHGPVSLAVQGFQGGGGEIVHVKGVDIVGPVFFFGALWRKNLG